MSQPPDGPSWHLTPGQPVPDPQSVPDSGVVPVDAGAAPADPLYAPGYGAASDDETPGLPTQLPDGPRSSRRAGTLVAVGLVGAGAVAGVIAASVLHLSSSQAATAATGTGTAQSGQRVPGQGFGQGVPGQGIPGDDGQGGDGGQGGGGFGGGGFGGGAGLAGEQRLAGTLTAVGSGSITVRTAAGTAEYVVDGQTQIVRDGAEASLSELKTGDTVLVHVYSVASTLHAERIFAGNLPGGGQGVPGQGGQGGQGGVPTPSSTI